MNMSGTGLCFPSSRPTKRNLRNLNNVIPLNMAVSEATGLRELFVASDNALFRTQGHRKQINSKETVQYVTGKGYEAFVFDGNDLVKFSRHNDELYNYFFLPA